MYVNFCQSQRIFVQSYYVSLFRIPIDEKQEKGNGKRGKGDLNYIWGKESFVNILKDFCKKNLCHYCTTKGKRKWLIQSLVTNGADPLCWKGRIAQPPHSAHKWAPFVFLTKLFFFMKCKVQTPSLMWRNKRVYFVLTRKNHGKIKAFIYNFMHDEVLWVRICNDERDNTRTNENVLTEFFAPSLSIYNWHQMNKIQ